MRCLRLLLPIVVMPVLVSSFGWMRSPTPDGQTLLFGSMSTHAMNEALFRNMPFDGVADFTPVALLAYVLIGFFTGHVARGWTSLALMMVFFGVGAAVTA